MPKFGCRNSNREVPSKNKISTIDLDLAKKALQIHAVDASGAAVLRRALRRGKVLELFAKSGHQVRLIPPARDC